MKYVRISCFLFEVDENLLFSVWCENLLISMWSTREFVVFYMKCVDICCFLCEVDENLLFSVWSKWKLFHCLCNMTSIMVKLDVDCELKHNEYSEQNISWWRNSLTNMNANIGNSVNTLSLKKMNKLSENGSIVSLL